ncbi:hypothetical protein KIN20_035910 [Parelaphostrongylus tenuis]|uniref:Uncharacterized protein n=1 Tax=Parelaphostrongylus tenuis TaxID=148309 RepID=A0AAD5RCE7_PARTN|nr:hypothetical protein KIN20_035910 [Parelaphostrongylus tenuis]
MMMMKTVTMVMTARYVISLSIIDRLSGPEEMNNPGSLTEKFNYITCFILLVYSMPTWQCFRKFFYHSYELKSQNMKRRSDNIWTKEHWSRVQENAKVLQKTIQTVGGRTCLQRHPQMAASLESRNGPRVPSSAA